MNSQISSPAGQGAAPLRAGIVPPLADGFTTRPESAVGLAEALVLGVAVAITPASATVATSPDWQGSCGKTQLAAWLAESLWRAKELDLLVWITASSRSAIVSGYAAATAAIGIGSSADAEDAAARFARWLGLTGQSWLVVLDGLADPSDAWGLWPSGPTGRTLITTSDPGISGHGNIRSFPISGLSRREALTFLMSRLTADWEQRSGAVDLVDHLGGEPLALTHAGAIVGSSAMSCRDYIDLFDRKRDQFAAAGRGVPATAAITWTISAELAGTQPPGGPAQAMLMLAALLDGRQIPGTVFVTSSARTYGGRGAAGGVASPESTWAGVVSLEQVGLVTIDPAVTPPIVRIDRAIQDVIRSSTPGEALDYALVTAANALLEAWPDDEQDPWLAASLRSCAASVRQLAGDLLWAGGGYRLLFRLGQSLDAARLSGFAVAHWSQLAESAIQILGLDHPDTLMAGDKLAAALLAAGRAADAAGWLRQVLDERAARLGAEHPATMAIQVSLGRALLAAGQPGDAIKVLDQAVGHCEHVLGADNATTLGVLEALADACQSAGHKPDAIRLYQRVLAGCERVHGAAAPATLDAAEKLGDAYRATDRLKDAMSSYKRVVSRREKALGSDHRDTIVARSKLASAYQSAGKMVIALQEYERCRADSERVLGPDHPDTLTNCVSLAHVYYAVGRIGDAATLLRSTIQRCDRVLLPDDPLRKTARDSLANITGESIEAPR